MELTRDDLLTSKIVFNHVSKAGGSSVLGFFGKVFGQDKCFRHQARDSKTGKFSPPIQDVPEEELNTYRFVAGHFDFGNHRRLGGRALYVGTMRDPIERVISDF